MLSTPTRWQKVCYGILTVGGRYGWTKWEDWLADQEGGYEEVSSSNMDYVFVHAKNDQPNPNTRFLSRLSMMVSTTHSMAAFASFLVFLVNGRYRTLLDRILRLRLAPPTNQVSREVSFEYLNRQLVWHAFTEFLLFLLPLVGISRWRRWIARAWRKSKSLLQRGEESEEATSQGELAFLSERTCAICYQDQNPTSTTEGEIMAISGASGGVVGSSQNDITNPYEAIACGCIYCFVCIATRLEAEEGEGFICLRCGELIKECKPWAGDVEEPQASSNKKKVGFSDGKDSDPKHSRSASHADAVKGDVANPGSERGIAMQSEQSLAEGLVESHEWAREESDSGTDVRNSG